jgi:hypothetical protein
VLLYAYIGLILAFSVLALLDWRRGIFCFVAIGVLQDVVRKAVPGAPAFLVLSTVPVWCSVVAGMVRSEQRPVRLFVHYYRPLGRAIGWFLASLVPAAIISSTYGVGSWKLALIGLFSYASFSVGIILGFGFAQRYDDIRRLLSFYCIVTTLMLGGTAVEYLGWGGQWSIVGTTVLDMEWIRYSGSNVISLVSGFYRSPDVMGWHAVTACMLAVMLARASRGRSRYFWILVCLFGGTAALLSGRRKMVFMLPIFVVVAGWALAGSSRGLVRRLRGALAGLAVLLIVGLSLYNFVDLEGMGDYYTRTGGELVDRIKQHGYESLVVTWRQSGALGAGLGTATQGAHHLQVERPRTWQEGGLGRILVELGLPGLICFTVMVLYLLRAVYLVTKRIPTQPRPEGVICAGLSGLFMANAGSFVISHQVFGDPFVMCLFTFLVGMLLSMIRVPPVRADCRHLEGSGVRSPPHAYPKTRRHSITGGSRAGM